MSLLEWLWTYGTISNTPSRRSIQFNYISKLSLSGEVLKTIGLLTNPISHNF